MAKRGPKPKEDSGDRSRHARIKEDLAIMLKWIHRVKGYESATILDPLIRKTVTDLYRESYSRIVDLHTSREEKEPLPPLPPEKPEPPVFPLLRVSNVPFALPVAGDVAASIIGLMVQDEGDDVFNFTEVFSKPSTRMLRVRGKSMEDAGILDGDYVVIRAEPDAPVGTDVVAYVKKSFTLKRVVKNTDGELILGAKNKAIKETIKLDPDRGDAVIGQLIGVVRKTV